MRYNMNVRSEMNPNLKNALIDALGLRAGRAAFTRARFLARMAAMNTKVEGLRARRFSAILREA